MDRILFVDDEPNVLASYQRGLRKKFRIDVASSGSKGLALLTAQGPYSVVVSDYRMPGMDGIEFLSLVREVDPNSVRMLLTGYADVETTMRAVNETNIFRLLTKPCPIEELTSALESGIRQYHLLTAEKELLEKTVKGCVKVLSELLSLARPEAFSRASRIGRYAGELSRILDDPDPWQTETAALLSPIGSLVLPDPKDFSPLQPKLTEAERRLLEEHSTLASNLIRHIPRMEEVARILAYQQKNYDGTGIPQDEVRGEGIPLGARILRVLIDFDALLSAGKGKGRAYAEIRKHPERYDPKVVRALEYLLGNEAKYTLKEVAVDDLKEGMILGSDLYTLRNKKLLLRKGHELTGAIIEYIKRHRIVFGIREPIRVIEPIEIL